MPITINTIAKAAHEAVRRLRMDQGDLTSPRWAQIADKDREGMLVQVKGLLSGTVPPTPDAAGALVKGVAEAYASLLSADELKTLSPPTPQGARAVAAAAPLVPSGPGQGSNSLKPNPPSPTPTTPALPKGQAAPSTQPSSQVAASGGPNSQGSLSTTSNPNKPK